MFNKRNNAPCTYVVDIDDTLLFSVKKECDHCGRVVYKKCDKNEKEIEKLRRLFDNGHRIILWTGRNWDCYDQTIDQLVEAKIPYDQLIMGKPQGIYIDADALKELPEIND